LLVPKGEQRSDASSLAPLASDLDRKLYERLQNVRIVLRYLAKDALKHQSLFSVQAKSA
jgi:hypothetical protein